MDQIQPQVNNSQMSPQDGGQPVSEEQRQALLEMINKVKGEISSLDATKFASGNKNEALRNDLLKQVFEKLQMAGVDLSSRESVAAFIMKLQENNPELAAMFEKAMDALLGTPEGGSMGNPQEAVPENNMNNVIPNETIPETL